MALPGEVSGLHHGDAESQDRFEEASAAARPSIRVIRPNPLEWTNLD